MVEANKEQVDIFLGEVERLLTEAKQKIKTEPLLIKEKKKLK